jgi:hypothetical protein
MAPMPTVQHPPAMYHDLPDGRPSRTAKSQNSWRTDPVSMFGITAGVQPPQGIRTFRTKRDHGFAAHLPIAQAAASATGHLQFMALRHSVVGKQLSRPVTSPDIRQPTVASGPESPNRPPDRLFYMVLDSSKRRAAQGVPSLVPTSGHRRPPESVSPARTWRQEFAPEMKLGRSEAARALSSKPRHSDLTDSGQRSLPTTNRQAPSDMLSGGQLIGATLHLDGAALGRWAIQHIERALARPSNGMTGVDPRATMPRGHISPF